jgi:hypothetical protein
MIATIIKHYKYAKEWTMKNDLNILKTLFVLHKWRKIIKAYIHTAQSDNKGLGQHANHYYSPIPEN